MQRARAVAARPAVRGPLSWLFVLCVGTPAAFAQAWVPPAGVGVVSIVYQTIDNTAHRLTDGSMLDGYDSASRGVLLNFDYALTDRFSFTLGVPYVASKYSGPEPSFFGLPIDDCLCWNHAWQDVGVTARYNLANGTFALTPSVSLGVPTHNYDYFGEAVVGRNLNELRIAIEAGQRLDVISDRLSVSARYSYALVEKVLDLSNNRSNISLEPGYLVTRRLLARAAFSWQRSHGGLRSTEFGTDEQFQQFDRILKDNSFHVGGGVSYSLPRFDVFASFVHYVSGTDTHVGHALAAGVSWPFER
jgi:hypothetical protein